VDKRAYPIWILAAVALTLAGPLGCWDTLRDDLGHVHTWMGAQDSANSNVSRRPVWVGAK
jgi:hypothetical protein